MDVDYEAEVFSLMPDGGGMGIARCRTYYYKYLYDCKIDESKAVIIIFPKIKYLEGRMVCLMLN